MIGAAISYAQQSDRMSLKPRVGRSVSKERVAADADEPQLSSLDTVKGLKYPVKNHEVVTYDELKKKICCRFKRSFKCDLQC
jgi:hypothetical protein